MQLKPHVISLQSITLFVRLTNHHCGKALMFRSIAKERKRAKSFPVQGLQSYTEQQSKARTGNRCSCIKQALLRPLSGSKAKSTHGPQGYPFPWGSFADVPGTDFPAKLLPACYKASFFENSYVIT